MTERKKQKRNGKEKKKQKDYKCQDQEAGQIQRTKIKEYFNTNEVEGAV